MIEANVIGIICLILVLAGSTVAFISNLEVKKKAETQYILDAFRRQQEYQEYKIDQLNDLLRYDLNKLLPPKTTYETPPDWVQPPPYELSDDAKVSDG